MSTLLTRRGVLAAAAALATAPLFVRTAGAGPARRLTASKRTIEVNGKPATVFGLTGGDGRPGAVLDAGERLALTLDNRAGEPTIIHWHGQTPPADQDGVTDTGYAQPIAAGTSRTYDFAPRQGTHWMHSHQGLQEQALLAAPLIVRSAEDAAADRQEVVVLLHDFSFRTPEEIFASLGGAMGHGASDGQQPGMAGRMDGKGGIAGMTDGMGGMMDGMQGMDGMGGMGGMDLNDVEYDAYLANDRTLADPQVVRTEAGGKVLLRLINAASSTAFWIDLGGAAGTVVAVDGNPVVPIDGSSFPLAQAQRLDVLVTVPAGSVVTVLAQREGDRMRTGIVLAAPGANVAKIAQAADAEAPPLDLSLEARLAALNPPAQRQPDVTHDVMLGGSMMPYSWTIDGATWESHRPLHVRKGQRVAIAMMNHSMMAHPMHLHGHHFQVIGINGRAFAGAMRDTVLVPPMGRVTIALDAGNPGRWLFHCHTLYHMAAGMMTEVVYDAA